VFTSLVTDGRTNERTDRSRTLCLRLSVWPGKDKNKLLIFYYYLYIGCLFFCVFFTYFMLFSWLPCNGEQSCKYTVSKNVQTLTGYSHLQFLAYVISRDSKIGCWYKFLKYLAFTYFIMLWSEMEMKRFPSHCYSVTRALCKHAYTVSKNRTATIRLITSLIHNFH